MRLFLHRFPAVGGLLLFAVLLCAAALAGPKYFRSTAATLIVTNTADSGPGSLRQALADVHDGDTIQFDAALNGQTITLTSGQLVINNTITVNGPGPTLLTLARNQQAADFRILYIPAGHTVEIDGLTITGGHVAGNGGAILNGATLTINNCAISGNSITTGDFLEHSGGGIHNDGTMTVAHSTVNNNQAVFMGGEANGGGISNAGTLTLDDAMIEMNSANFNGGGIINDNGSITITGSTITGNQVHTFFHQAGYGGGICNRDGRLTILHSTINGNVNGGDPDGGNGGGVYSSGPFFTLAYSTISGNSAILTGGGVSNSGSFTMESCTISGNSVLYYGGGIYGSGTITNSTISNNQTMGFNEGGGGIVGTFTITNSTISNNMARGNGGGILGTSTITNSTISSNVATTNGGGISGDGTITLCTISDNVANQTGGGIYATGAIQLGNTILKTGTQGANLVVNGGGTILSHGYNLSNDNGGGFLTGPGDQINTDPMLGPLQNNGGPTSTYNLLPGSSAIDAGDPNFTPPPFTDQRGFGYLRVYNGRIDIGSLEVQPAATISPTPTATATASATPTATATSSPTPTATATATATATPTATPTPTSTATATPPATPTPTPTIIPTPTPTSTPTPTPTPTPTLTPTPTPNPSPTPARALNISTRLRVETGDRVMIGGFIITGSAPKMVAVRGIGPSLGNLGLTDVLTDPTLELRSSDGALLMQNDNWQDDAAQAAQLTTLGLELQDAKESGMVTMLQPSASYTAILAGKNGGAGVGLVEIYDTNQAADSQLANISTRGFVQTGENVMIGGFILGGNNQNTGVVVRGIGPSLAQFGLSPVLTDPTLELRDSNGALLISNDDWQDDSVPAAQLSALGLAPQDPKESGIFMSLPPGAFTAILAGKNGGTGIGLVEIYNVH